MDDQNRLRAIHTHAQAILHLAASDEPPTEKVLDSIDYYATRILQLVYELSDPTPLYAGED